MFLTTRRVVRPAVLVTVAAAAVTTAAIGLRTAAATAEPPRVGLPAFVADWASLRSSGGSATADTGPAGASDPVAARVYLTGRDPRGLAAYATAASDPRNPLYRHYLTAAQVRQRFGPTASQTAAVRSWLTTAGLRVTEVTAHYVAVEGTAAGARAAFGATWHTFQVGGTAQQAPATGARLTAPARLAAAVLTVAPMETGKLTPPGPTGPPPASTATSADTPPPTNEDCSSYYGQNLATGLPAAYGRTVPRAGCGYTPQQLRSAYGVPADLTGAGVTVAVTGLGSVPNAAKDVATFGAAQGQPMRDDQLTQVVPPGVADSCPGLASEEAFDFEAVHDMAPDADIVYVGMACTQANTSALDGLTIITDRHLASIVANSWGIDGPTSQGLAAAYEQVFEQGAAQGIGFYFSTGDFGDDSTTSPDGKPSVNYPASDPWVTAVGGTSLAVGQDGGYEWETSWGSRVTGLTADGTAWSDPPGTFTGGSSGGTSPLFDQPSYQRGVVPTRLSRAGGATTPKRVLPDIAADADFATGMLAGATFAPPGQPEAFHLGIFGGTSLSAPLVAGMQADAEQAAGAALGFANPALYAHHRAGAYHDVTDRPLGAGTTLAVVGLNSPPSLITLGVDDGLAAVAGYDNATGLGSPTGRYFNSYRH